MSVYRQYKHLALDRGDDPPMAASDFERIETLLGVSLPESVRDFLQHTSGAELEYVFHPSHCSDRDRDAEPRLLGACGARGLRHHPI